MHRNTHSSIEIIRYILLYSPLTRPTHLHTIIHQEKHVYLQLYLLYKLLLLTGSRCMLLVALYLERPVPNVTYLQLNFNTSDLAHFCMKGRMPGIKNSTYAIVEAKTNISVRVYLYVTYHICVLSIISCSEGLDTSLYCQVVLHQLWLICLELSSLRL